MIARIIVGLIICVIGFYMVKKPDTFLGFIGPIMFAEKVFSGGSRSFYKLLGVVVILIGFLVMTNLYGDIINGFLGMLFR